MPNWTQNIITFGTDVSQERFEEVLLKVMRTDQTKMLHIFSSIVELKKACDEKQAQFDFNTLIPIPESEPESAVVKWCRDNWGTKWNAQNTQVDWEDREICFQTAGKEPDKIMTAFRKAFPDITFEWLYAADDPAWGAGIVYAKNGIQLAYYPPNFSFDALEYYAECWGTSDNLYQDEKGIWHWED